MYRTRSFKLFAVLVACLCIGALCAGCGTTTNGAEGDDLPTGQQTFTWTSFPPFPNVEGMNGDLAKLAIDGWVKAVEKQAGTPFPQSIVVTMHATIDKSVSGSQSVSSAVEAALEAQVRDLFKPGT